MPAVTEKIRLGYGQSRLLRNAKHPIWLAKEVASLDMISNGRFELGVGYGWCKEEMRNHGLDYSKRRGILRENLLLCKELWTQDEASFSGKHIQFEQSWAWPKPTQQPHPPIVMGGAAGPKTAAHIAEFCDGWMPIGGNYDLDGGLKTINEACKNIGRRIPPALP